MSFFSNLKLKFKILLCFCVIIALVVIQGITSYAALSDAASECNEVRATVQNFQKQSDDKNLALDKTIQQIDNVYRESKNSMTIIITISILIIVLAFVFSNILSISIGKRTQDISNISSKVADGDLTVEIDKSNIADDEIGSLTTSFTTMVEHLKQIISNIVDHSETISNAAYNLRATNETLSESTSEILSQTLTVSAASEEMAATSKEIALNCNAAASSSEQTRNTTLDSIDAVRNTVAKIREHSQKTQEDAKIIEKLGEETKQIDAIIATIQDIASQTNLLALNAAIEAARAGEHGRGFAVVSDEVRALANRTAQSTQEINTMIKAVQDEVSVASTSIGQTVEQMEVIAAETEELEHSLDTIINQVQDVNTQITQIAAATEEQTRTSENMSQNLQKVADLTKEVSNNISDAVNSSTNMADLSEEMVNSTKMFKF